MKHCYLDEARCERGAEYAKTGVLPPRKPRPEGAHDKRHSEQKMKYLAISQEEKLIWNIKEMGFELAQQESCGDAFDCLREEDRATLLMLLEKVKHDWRRHAKEQVEG